MYPAVIYVVCGNFFLVNVQKMTAQKMIPLRNRGRMLPLSSFSCTQNFLWKQTTRLMDGTTIVLKSIPCEAGVPDDVCLVEVRSRLSQLVLRRRRRVPMAVSMSTW